MGLSRSLWVILLGVFLTQTGCRATRYYAQAIRGHCDILLRQEPIEEVLRRPGLTPVEQSRLRLVLALRTFAEEELGLEAGGHYLNYVELGRPFVVWNVYATPEFSLDAKTWRYPVVGSLSYRGFFSETQARAYAEKLADEGQDVYVGGVDAYSTLGWFNDPVLDTFLLRDEMALADLIFHELAHQKLFVKGDTNFNEAFATAVAREGVRRWIRASQSPAMESAYEAWVSRQDEFVELILQARRELEGIYAAMGDAGNDVEVWRLRKKEVLDGLRMGHEALKATWPEGSGFDAWFEGPVNNARLHAESTYHELVPGFERLLGRVEGDMPAFYREVRVLGRLPEGERERLIAHGVPDADTVSGWTHLGP